MSASLESLKPCPFCGSNKVMVVPANHWSGMRNIVLSVELRHWCDDQNGVNRVFVSAKGKTEENAVDQWNRRTVNSTAEP